eukprot:7187115-Pyramimonas_sp.AAC.1
MSYSCPDVGAGPDERRDPQPNGAKVPTHRTALHGGKRDTPNVSIKQTNKQTICNHSSNMTEKPNPWPPVN